METVIHNEDFSAHLLPQINAIVTTRPQRNSTPLIKETTSSKMAYWGDGNDFPQIVIDDIRKDPEIGTMLDKQARLLYSSGLVYGTIDFKENGDEILKPPSPEVRKTIDTWLRKSNINRYIYEGARDLYFFYNVFPEVVRSVDDSKIIQLCIQPAEHCRFGKQNKRGIIDTCFINAQFPAETELDPRTIVLPVLDPYYDPAENLRNASGHNFIYPLSIPTAGSTYYQLADWNSVRSSGWLDVSKAIPKFKKNYIEKQLNIKYHIEISDQYWPLKFEGWAQKKAAEQAKIKNSELKVMNDLLSGLEKSGNSLVTAFKSNFDTGKEFSLWKINVIDDKIKDGKFLEDGKDASLYKATAVGLHPALIGAMPNSGMGGAGSNIREAYNLHMLSVRAHQDILLEPLELVKAYNGWPDDIVFRFRNSFMNTLDKGKETTKTTG
jgi:hypothetical protein